MNRPEYTEGDLFIFQATISSVFRFAQNAFSASSGGMWPMGPSSRRLLYQSTHLRVSHSTSRIDFHGPIWLTTSVLNRPMTHSAKALSKESLTVPTEGSMPT